MRPSDVIAYKRMCLENWNPRKTEFLHMARFHQAYFVSGEMTDVVMAAGETLPVEGVPETVLPSREGFMIFEKPLGRAEWFANDPEYPENATDIIGVMWRAWTEWSSPDDEKVALTALLPAGESPGEDDPDERALTVASPSIELYPLIRALGVPLPARELDAAWFWNPGQPEEAETGLLAFNNDHGETDRKMMRAIIASWLLMGQTLAWVDTSQADRAQRKLARRIGLRSDVVVVRLRKLTRKQEGPEGALIEWSHRWLVSGHWRRQWYPSACEHRPMWISPHIKGPPDKPLVTKDRVIALVR